MPLFLCWLRRPCVFSQCVEFLAWLETHGFSGRDAYLGSGARIASDSGFAGADAENAESAQFNALARCKSFLQTFKHSVHCRFGLRAGQACALDHMVHDVLFNQSGHLASTTVLDCTTPYRTDVTAFGSFVEQRGKDFCTRRESSEGIPSDGTGCRRSHLLTKRIVQVFSRRLSLKARRRLVTLDMFSKALHGANP